MKLNIFRTLILAMALSFGTVAIAQNDSSSYNESVIVVGDYKPVLEQSFKFNVAPSITDTNETMNHTFSYSITPQRLTAIFSPARLAHVKITEPPQRLYNNYLRFGMGNYWTPMMDLYYNSTRSKNLAYGARLFHQSSWGTIGKKVDSIPHSASYYGPNHFANTQLSLFGKYILKDKVQFSSALDVENDYLMYYGFNDSTLHAVAHQTGVIPTSRDSISKRDYGMVYNLFNWTAGVKNLSTDVKKFGYEANLGLSNLVGRYGMNEWDLHLDGDIHYGFKMFEANKGIAYLHADFDRYHTQYHPQFKADSSLLLPLGFYNVPVRNEFFVPQDTNRFTLKVNPYFDFIFRQFQIHAGLRVAIDGFSNPGESKLGGLFPDVVVSTSFLDDDLSINLGAVGNLTANTWNSLRLANPYVMPVADEWASKETDFYGHMRYSINKKLELNVRGDLTFYKNDVTFRLLHEQYPLGNIFKPMRTNYERAALGADLTFVNDEMITLEVGGHYYMYIMNDKNFEENVGFDCLLYRPKYDAHLTAHVNYKDKVLVHFQTLLMGKMNADMELSPDRTTWYASDTVPMRTGINLEVEYLHSRALSFFLKFDNILSQRYFYWAHYPSQRINVMAGLTYTIPTKKQ